MFHTSRWKCISNCSPFCKYPSDFLLPKKYLKHICHMVNENFIMYQLTDLGAIENTTFDFLTYFCNVFVTYLGPWLKLLLFKSDVGLFGWLEFVFNLIMHFITSVTPKISNKECSKYYNSSTLIYLILLWRTEMLASLQLPMKTDNVLCATHRQSLK